MTPEEEIEIEIARSIINEQIADLARKRAWEDSHGSKSLALEIEELIIKLRNRQYSLTAAEAKEIIDGRY